MFVPVCPFAGGEGLAAAEATYGENADREDLDPIEDAEGLRTMLTAAQAEGITLTHAQLAERLGMRRESITNRLRLLDLPGALRDRVRSGDLPPKTALGLLAYRRCPGLLDVLTEHFEGRPIPTYADLAGVVAEVAQDHGRTPLPAVIDGVAVGAADITLYEREALEAFTLGGGIFYTLTECDADRSEREAMVLARCRDRAAERDRPDAEDIPRARRDGRGRGGGGSRGRRRRRRRRLGPAAPAAVDHRRHSRGRAAGAGEDRGPGRGDDA